MMRLPRATVAVLTVGLAWTATATTATAADWFVDDDAPGDPAPGDPTISDPAEDGSMAHPFDSIAEAVAAASDGDVVVLLPGSYTGPGNRDVQLSGWTDLTIRGDAGTEVTIIDAEGTSDDPRRAFWLTTPDTAVQLEGLTITGGRSGVGGAILANPASSLDIRSCAFVDNAAEFAGGALQLAGSAAVIEDCRFVGNAVLFDGGGAIGGNDGGSVVVRRSVFEGNTGTDQGGAIKLSGNALGTLVHCLFIENETTSFGGAVGVRVDSDLEMRNCTLIDNVAGSGGGGVWTDGSPTAIRNSILRGGVVGLVSGPASIDYSNIEGGSAGVGNIDADPVFVDPSTDDYRIAAGSPCIDAANTLVILGDGQVDLAGAIRVYDDPETMDTGIPTFSITVDMGAFEFDPSVAVTCAGDTDGDGIVGFADLLATLAAWGPCP